MSGHLMKYEEITKHLPDKIPCGGELYQGAPPSIKSKPSTLVLFPGAKMPPNKPHARISPEPFQPHWEQCTQYPNTCPTVRIVSISCLSSRHWFANCIFNESSDIDKVHLGTIHCIKHVLSICQSRLYLGSITLRQPFGSLAYTNWA